MTSSKLMTIASNAYEQLSSRPQRAQRISNHKGHRERLEGSYRSAPGSQLEDAPGVPRNRAAPWEEGRRAYHELGEDAVLLCYEEPGQFWHRRLVAEWFKLKLGVTVSEI